MWYLRFWPTLIAITVSLALETNILFVRSSYLGYDGRRLPRQASAITTPIDYSSVAPPTHASGLPVSNPAIVIPFFSPSATPTPTFLSTSALLTVSSSKNATSTSTTHSLSLTAPPTPSAQNTTAEPTFKIIYLIPAFALVGILLGALVGWVVYGCMTRKPRMRKDDGALLIGPRYIGIQEPERHHNQDHDIQRRIEPAQTVSLPGAMRPSPHFRWPSFNEKPTFHPDSGFHIPDEYLHDDDPFSTLPLATRSNTTVTTRTKTMRTARTFKSPRTLKSTRTTIAGPSCDALLSPTSDTTSLAFLELYESDEEEEKRRKAHEVPWESLRHKSIKRGILEQVKKESKWMDSIRGLAGSTLLGSRPAVLMKEDDVLLGGPDADDSMEVDSYVGRRRGYPVPDSDPFADSAKRTHSNSPKKRPVAKSRRTDSTTVRFQIISESAATTPNQSPRRGFTWLKKDDGSNSLEKLSRLSTPFAEDCNEGQSPNRNKSSRSQILMKRNGLDLSHVSRLDILPQSPAQIMSPPLQSQICFTPIPASSARLHPSQSSRDYHSKSISQLSPIKPLMFSSASKTKKKLQSPHHPPNPPSAPSANTLVPDGRQRPTTRQAKAESRVNMLDDPIKKVERIMASSWSARDLGQGEMRSLSPTGFGRRPLG